MKSTSARSSRQKVTRTTFLLVFCLLVTSLFYQCRKKIPSYRIKPETLEYCNFNIGSYWIYQDQFGKIDTVTVLRYSRGSSSEHLSYEREVIFMFTDSTGGEKIESHEIDEVYNNYQTLTYHSLPLGGTHLGTTFLEQSDSLGSFKGNIKHFVITGSSLPDSIRVTDEYRLKNVGVIQRTFKDGRIHHLIDYHVIQE